MSNPVIVSCPADIWTKVATNVTSGNLHKVYKTSRYLQTYRVTGGTAPTDETEGVPCFAESDSEVIQSSGGIDVYVLSLKYDGKVRVDV